MARLLVICSNHRLRNRITRDVRHGGHAVREAASGLTAIATTITQALDAVVIGANVGRIDGLILFRELRRTSPGLPAVFVTEDASPGVVGRIEEAGAVHVPAPVASSDLLAAVDRVLATRHSPAQAAG